MVNGEIHTPTMGWQTCRYVFDGTDPEDGDYYRCVIHDRLTLGHEVSCEGAEAAGEDLPNGTCDECGAPIPNVAEPGHVRRCAVSPDHDPYSDGFRNGGDPIVKAVEDLTHGDKVDGEGDPYIDEGDDPSLEFEYLVVDTVYPPETSGRFAGNVPVEFQGGSFVRFPRGHLVVVAP